jgi:ribosomal protein L11 methyltransferase
VEVLSAPGEADRGALIDIGCGSGILAIAALKLGVRRALGVDVDPQAVEAARQNATLNGVLDCLETGVGSVEEILAGNYSICEAPLVVANILAPVLVRLLQGGMANLVSKGGFLLLSGILEGQAEDVLRAGEGGGLKLVEHRRMQDWAALVFSNK